MGYTLVKYLDSAEYHRVLFYLDRGESDLPPVDKNIISPGSKSVSQSTGQEWFLDTNYEWKPVRNFVGCKNCGKNKYGGNEFEVSPIVDKVKIFPNKLTMNKNANAQLIVSVSGDDVFDTRVKWEVLGSKSADTYITQDGLLHIGTYTRPQPLTVRATSLLDNKKFDEIPVQVDPYASLFGEIFGMEIFPKQPTLGIGKTLQFEALISGNGSYSKDVEWSLSSNSSSSIDEFGKLTVGEDEKSPVIIVNAVSTFNNKIVSSMPVIISDSETAPTVTSVKIIPNEFSIGVDSYALLAAIVEGTGDYIPDVAWSVTATSPQTLITNSGILTVGKDELEGDIEITAVSVLDDTISDTITVHIDKAIPSSDKKVFQVIVEPKNLTVYRSYNAVFSAKVTGRNISDQNVYWSVERNTSPYTKIKPNGSFVTATEEDASAVIVKATSVEDPSIYGLSAVKIIDLTGSQDDPTPTPVVKAVSDLQINENKELIVLFTDGTSKDLGRIQGQIYVPHITEEEKVLSFTLEDNPEEPPAPVDLSVDLSKYALKTEIISDKYLIAAQDIGGIQKGTEYPAETEIRQIVEDMFEEKPEGEIFFYMGSSRTPPTDYSGFQKISGYKKSDLIGQKITLTIPIPEGSMMHYGIAVSNEVQLIDWNPESQPGMHQNYITVDKGNYTIYYSENRGSLTLSYDFTFKEAE